MKFSIFLPGPLSLGFSYKAISTLDSMIGYKYDYFRYLGFFSAKFEDLFTFVPSRLVLITLPLVSSKVNEYISIIKKSYLDGKSMIRLILGFQNLYLHIFLVLNWEEKVNIKMKL